ncbi:putative Late nodulin [Medicago truncatula]|uniref:Nodule Cysteine-Rich (NCR) secreted peptide n=1 Tax=Medicago truncatula TaxID=3880 RepID=G7KS99_MEDTR|nr:Nodule Cysteine-Rich (NCR) secreted peptide [Medicago truncatula]RHN46450.1 putative Late nodulin [Medicago truncatula]
MNTIPKFVYITILFISLLLVVTGAVRKPECRQNSDCPPYFCIKPTVPKCIKFKCLCK